MEKKKRSKKWIVAVVIVLLAYPIYFCVVQVCTKSDSLSLFPSDGVWVAEAEGYSIEIDRDADAVSLTVVNGNISIDLELAESGGHGTPLWPTSSTSILYCTSENLDQSDENYVAFSCSKFKFNEDDFYLYNICLFDRNNLSVIQNKTTLHFVRQGVQN